MVEVLNLAVVDWVEELVQNRDYAFEACYKSLVDVPTLLLNAGRKVYELDGTVVGL